MTDRELLDALARDVAEALTAIADREENWAGVTRSFASSIYDRHARWPEADSHKPDADSHQQQATIPPADADDAGTRLVAWLDDIDAPVLVDLARDVIRERDEARRKCEDAMADALHAHTARLAAERERDEARRALEVVQGTLRDALAREVDATARADAAERERDEARRDAAHYTDMAMQADVSCQREKARADAAEATVRELRKLSRGAAMTLTYMISQARSISQSEVPQRYKMVARLRAAAVQPASEGRADG